MLQHLNPETFSCVHLFPELWRKFAYFSRVLLFHLTWSEEWCDSCSQYSSCPTKTWVILPWWDISHSSGNDSNALGLLSITLYCHLSLECWYQLIPLTKIDGIWRGRPGEIYLPCPCPTWKPKQCCNHSTQLSFDTRAGRKSKAKIYF